MGEREGMKIRMMFERQGLLNQLLVFNLISLENDLLIERARARARIDGELVDIEGEGELADIEATDKLSEILNDLILDQGDHTIQDLANELNQKDFPPAKKKLFKSLLTQMGIPEDWLNALKA